MQKTSAGFGVHLSGCSADPGEAAGKGGLPVIEYNFYAHRAIEGYYENRWTRSGGYTGFDYELDILIDPETNQIMSPLYRDEEGKITEATLAAFPNAKRIKFKDLPALQNEGGAQSSGNVGKPDLLPESRDSRG
jgi:hypothetical protein